MAQYTTFQAIQDHLMADAPCSESSLRAYCMEQTNDYLTCFASALCNLIDMGIVEYVADEDGDFYMIGAN